MLPQQHCSLSPIIVPHLDLCVLEALGHKVNRLVGLILIRLHCCLLWVKRLVLWLIRQSVLKGQTNKDRQDTHTHTQKSYAVAYLCVNKLTTSSP